MSSINRQPTGWLGFLGIKNFGRNPETVASVLAPTWDLSELYLAANRIYVSANATISATGFNQTASVPPGQVWAVYGYSYITNALVAGNSLQMQIAIAQLAVSVPVPIGGSSSGLVAPGSNAIAAIQQPLILGPGEGLGAYVTTFAGANIAALVNFCYTRLDA